MIRDSGSMKFVGDDGAGGVLALGHGRLPGLSRQAPSRAARAVRSSSTAQRRLLLDEPTNHLDLPSREAFEHAFDSFEGAALVITHDRYFIERFADRVIELSPSGNAS